MHLIECSRSYADQILAIYNDAILTTTAMYEYSERPKESMTAWFAAKEQGGYPVIGLVDDHDRLRAFGTYGPFRTRPAYHYTIEHSVYVHKDHRGKGLGPMILSTLIERAIEQQYHCMVAAIDSDNAASIHMHEKAGFEPIGVVKEVGYKFGAYRSLALMQLLLPTPEKPKEIQASRSIPPVL
jgi:phosphinothricin acetyltransferase